MRFNSVEQAIKFSFNVSERAEYARSDLLGVRGTSQDDLSPTDLHAQAAMIHVMLGRLHPAERDAMLALYGRGKARADGIRGLTEFLWPALGKAIPRKGDAQIVMLHWATKRPSIRKIAEERGVSYRQVCNWRGTVLRSWMPFIARATERLHDRMFKEGGFDLS